MKRSRGNFVVLSGLIVAAIVGLVGFWTWNFMNRSAAQAEKPRIVAVSDKPIILGPAIEGKPVVMEMAQAVEEKAVEAAGLTVPAAPVDEEAEAAPKDAPAPEPAIPDAIASSKEAGTWIFIDKANFRLYLAEKNTVLDSWGIAVGKNTGNKRKSGDLRTPEGKFTIQQIQDSSSWNHDFKDGKGVIKNAYGPWFIRIKTGWSGIGIHGTHDPDSIGTLATEGCVRMKNEELEVLKAKVSVGMPVLIASNATEDDKAYELEQTKKRNTAKRGSAKK